MDLPKAWLHTFKESCLYTMSSHYTKVRVMWLHILKKVICTLTVLSYYKEQNVTSFPLDIELTFIH